jgi:hypothetical protein
MLNLHLVEISGSITPFGFFSFAHSHSCLFKIEKTTLKN